MLRLSLASVRHQSRQYLAPGLAVVLGVAFVAATLTLTGTLSSSTRAAVAGQYAQYSSVVVPGGDRPLPNDLADQITAVEGVETLDPVRTGTALLHGPGGESVAVVTTESEVSPHPVVEGRVAQGPDEVALSETVAAGSGLDVGDIVEVVALSNDDVEHRATVVGVIDIAGDPRYGGGTPAVFATANGVTTLTGSTGWGEIAVIGSRGEEATTASLRSALEAKGADVTVRTASEHADAKVTEFTGGTDFLGVFLMAFAVIALFVSAIVIGNTFSILLARRSRETALLRAVGATRAQVVRSSLMESFVVGVVFSGIGALVGVLLAWGLARSGWALAGDSLPTLVFDVPARAVTIPILTGVIVVLVAALLPVLRSSRVAPLEALRPDPAVTATSRAGRWRVAVGVVLTLLGFGALIAGALLPSISVGVVGGLVSFTGVVLAGTVLVPCVVRAVGLVVARPFGPAGRLAVDNAVRNPARAAATASALLVGVTLVTMTAVGAATARTAVTDFINAQYPVDVVVQGANIPDSSATAIADVDGVTGTAALAGTEATALVADSSGDTTVAALPDDLGHVVRASGTMPEVDEASVAVPREAADAAGITDGDRVLLQGPDGRVGLTARVENGFEDAWLVTPETLDEIDSSPVTRALFLRLDDSGDVRTTVNEVKELAAGITEGRVGGGAPVRAANLQVLDTALVVVLALLAISVIISVVGIANTLSLSVIERTRESALMRALGMTRSQLRGMLGIESVLLALVGVVVGGILGTGYALAGVRALFDGQIPVSATVPWGQLSAIAAVAVVAGLLASVLPARRAVSASPAQALAAE